MRVGEDGNGRVTGGGGGGEGKAGERKRGDGDQWVCPQCTFVNEYMCGECNTLAEGFAGQEELEATRGVLEQVKQEHAAVRRQISEAKHTRRIVEEVVGEMAMPGGDPEAETAADGMLLQLPSSTSGNSRPLVSSESSAAELWDALFGRAVTPDREFEMKKKQDDDDDDDEKKKRGLKRGLATSAEYRKAISQLEKELSEMQLKQECGICFEDPAEVTFAPCGHRFVCTCCSKALNAAGHRVKCPLCRCEVTAFLNSYRQLDGRDAARSCWTCPSCGASQHNRCFVCEFSASLVDPSSLQFLESSLREARKNLFLSRQHLQELRESLSYVLASQFPPPPDSLLPALTPSSSSSSSTSTSSSSSPLNAARLAPYEKQLAKLLEQVAQLQQQNECQTCHSQPATVTFFPCGDHISCKPCARSAKRCPSCGKPIESLIVTYQA